MAQDAVRQATARSPLEFVACSRCRASYSPELSFYLTDCAHTLCQACTDASIAQSSAADPDRQPLQDGITCPACGHEGPVVQLDHAPALQHCFRPIQDLINELGMATEWQISNLVEQLAFFRDKCAEQKKMLAKAASELKKMRELKERLRQLEDENAAFQQQLAAATAQSPAAPRTAQDRPQANLGRSLAQFSAHDQNVPPRMPSHAPQQGLMKQPTASTKRPRASPDQFAAGPAARSPSVAKALVAPSRLSLTPAQQKQTAARLSAESSSSRPHAMHAMQPSAFDGGQSSRPQSRQLDAQTEQSTKDRLARFAYDPSRSTDRPASAAPALGRNPAPLPNYGPGAEGQPRYGAFAGQNHAYEMTSNSPIHASADSEPAMLDDRQLMPPPPVPSRRQTDNARFHSSGYGAGVGHIPQVPHSGQFGQPSSFEQPHHRFESVAILSAPQVAALRLHWARHDLALRPRRLTANLSGPQA
ncbi:hypothetical protein BMF94_0282 [Rhodotorula taiwanensis]|uniref:RING-type domain-containing protein n=1 Tax=Rhodotorula taiwanensis TaxID=741276 RepID=A0A2S5BIU6_9BASI|nr:hypothetical protein BMF94_0282 [Rhodotorula taiwanensis]